MVCLQHTNPHHPWYQVSSFSNNQKYLEHSSGPSRMLIHLMTEDSQCLFVFLVPVMTSSGKSRREGGGTRRKRSWSRAVFSSLQRKGLERRFSIQKYITKPDRRQLAATLGLTDAQVFY